MSEDRLPIMRPLDRRQLAVLRIRGAIAAVGLSVISAFWAFLLLGGGGASPAVWLGWSGTVSAFLLLILVVILPPRRWRAWAFRESDEELWIARGLLVRVETVVPLDRVQHIDISQGPIERSYGVGTIILHTAGTRGASVPLPGLDQKEAEEMRDRIRGHARRDAAWIS